MMYPRSMAYIMRLLSMIYKLVSREQGPNLKVASWDYQNSMWFSNKGNRKAFNAAVKNDHAVARLVLKNASLECLMSERDENGKAPISMLCDAKHDEFIISVLEAAKRAKVDHPTPASTQIVDIQEEVKVYKNIKMGAHSYPMSHDSVERISLEKLDRFDLELTPINNTILHLVSKLGDIKYVTDIIEKHPSLLSYRNSEGETPAYIAAREGHMDILETMIHYFKMKNDDDIEWLLTRTIDNNTALHVAIQNHHVGVVFLLIKEIPQLLTHINNSKESPVYLAVERSYVHLLRLMLHKAERAATFEGPNNKTPLHVAAISGSTECIEQLLSGYSYLRCMEDNHGWTPLQHAIHHKNGRAIEALLENPEKNGDVNVGYEIKMKDDGKSYSLVHFASAQGNRETMKVIISRYPGCSDITDSQGKNILHIAIDNKNTQVIEYIFQDESLTYLINRKDNDGNTPIHLFMASELDMIEKVMDSRVDINVVNNEGNTPLDVASSKEKGKRLLQAVMGIKNAHVFSKEDVDNAFEDAQGFLVVVTLIMTSTYAAAFTVPGGFNIEGFKQGIPIFIKNAAFEAFMVTNTIAFSCSCSALSGYFFLIVFRGFFNRNPDGSYSSLIINLVSFISSAALYAIVAVGIAFVTGIYVVLTPYPDLATAVCIITLSSFIPLWRSCRSDRG